MKFKYQLFLFLFFGGIIMVLEMGVYWCILENTEWHYLVANIIPVIFGISISYFIYKNWVFKSKRKGIIVVLLFLFSAFITIGSNELMLWILVKYAMFTPIVAKPISVVLAAGISFYTKKYIVFQDQN